MFEVVYETRKDGGRPDDPEPAATSLVLNSTFASEKEAQKACRDFQSAFEERWEEQERGWYFGRTAKEPGKVSIWYARPRD